MQGTFYRLHISAPEWSGYCCWYTEAQAEKHRINGQLVSVAAMRSIAQEFTEEQARHIADALGIRIVEENQTAIEDETIAKLERV